MSYLLPANITINSFKFIITVPASINCLSHYRKLIKIFTEVFARIFKAVLWLLILLIELEEGILAVRKDGQLISDFVESSWTAQKNSPCNELVFS